MFADASRCKSKIVMKTLERDRNNRYKSASEVADAIRNAASDPGTLTGAPRLGKLVRSIRENPTSSPQQTSPVQQTPFHAPARIAHPADSNPCFGWRLLVPAGSFTFPTSTCKDFGIAVFPGGCEGALTAETPFQSGNVVLVPL